MAAARLYLEAARRIAPNDPATLLNLAVALAQGHNLGDAFLTLGLCGAASASEPQMTFQVYRWAGHLYEVAGRGEESRGAYAEALRLYESGGEWADVVDDGVFTGGAVEWGLMYEEGEGLAVTLDIPASPLFFVPAPVSVMALSVAGAP